MKTVPKTNCILHTTDSPEHLAYYLWSLSVLQVYPGSVADESDNIINTYQWVPVDANHTIVYRSWFFKNSKPTAKQMKLIETDRTTFFAEVINIIEAVQRGMKNRGYRPGPLVVGKQGMGTINSENGIYALHQLLRNALKEETSMRDQKMDISCG